MKKRSESLRMKKKMIFVVFLSHFLQNDVRSLSVSKKTTVTEKLAPKDTHPVRQ